MTSALSRDRLAVGPGDPSRDPAAGDWRLADFKLLLPLGPTCQALVGDTGSQAFVPHLAGELGALDLLAPALVPRSPADASSARAASELSEVRQVQAPAGPYDLVFSRHLADARHLRPGGLLCRFIGPGTNFGSPPPGLIPVGRWRAWPSWPAFRALIPAGPRSAAGWRAAARALRLYPARSPLGLATRLWPGSAALLLPPAGIALYRVPGAPGPPSLLASLAQALAQAQDERRSADPAAGPWLLLSGRLGVGNPILALRLDACGRPLDLIKAARSPGARHLQHEADQLAAIARALDPVSVRRLIRPSAAVEVRGRCALAYDFVPTHPFFGVRWRVQARRRFCLAMTAWLAALAGATRRPAGASAATARAPLQRLLGRGLLAPATQHQAAQALDALTRLGPALPLVLEHGDLGVYNVRLTAADGSDFKVLDWGSADLAGVPVGDLCYLLASARAPVALAVRCLCTYLQALALPPALAPALWFSYLARRWEELDQVRPACPGDPSSGGGILLPTQARVAGYLAALPAASQAYSETM